MATEAPAAAPEVPTGESKGAEEATTERDAGATAATGGPTKEDLVIRIEKISSARDNTIL